MGRKFFSVFMQQICVCIYFSFLVKINFIFGGQRISKEREVFGKSLAGIMGFAVSVNVNPY